MTDWLAARFEPGEYDDGTGKNNTPMFMSGIPVSRWIDGVLETKTNISQRDSLKGMVFWGHAPNSQVR